MAFASSCARARWSVKCSDVGCFETLKHNLPAHSVSSRCCKPLARNQLESSSTHSPTARRHARASMQHPPTPAPTAQWLPSIDPGVPRPISSKNPSLACSCMLVLPPSPAAAGRSSICVSGASRKERDRRYTSKSSFTAGQARCHIFDSWRTHALLAAARQDQPAETSLKSSTSCVEEAHRLSWTQRPWPWALMGHKILRSAGRLELQSRTCAAADSASGCQNTQR